MSKVDKILKSVKPYTSLDTLEITSEIFKGESHKTLYNTAIRKHRTNKKVKALFDISNNKIYWKTWHCNTVLLQEGQTLKGSLCRKRWCNHCNRIRTAELIKSYQKPLKDLSKEDNLYLVTLTAPTVKARQLKSEIEKRYQAWRRVKDRLRKQGVILNGIRKLEIEYNTEMDWFHPHFHFVCQGKIEAHLLRAYWLEEFKKASIKAQHITEVGTKAKDLMEVFKYATKDIVTDETTAKASHIIYQAIKGRRIFQTFGTIKKVKQPKKEVTQSIKYKWLNPNDYEIWYYSHDIKDYKGSYGKILIGSNYISNQLTQLRHYGSNNKRKKRLSISTQKQAKNPEAILLSK